MLNVRMGQRTIASVFDPRANGLNAIRLMLAVSVIVWHSFPLTGNTIAWGPLRTAVSEVGVDGFFALSGFLIVSSWLRRPSPAVFLRARALRILPGFYTCLLLTGLVLAPLGVALQGESPGRVLGGAVQYVLRNAGVWIFQFDIAGTPQHVPYGGAWNGSLWTLGWEVLCYLAVLALGLFGLLRRRRYVLLAAGVAWLLALTTALVGVESQTIVSAGRFGLMFFVGAALYVFADRVPVHPAILGASAVILIASFLLPDYRVLGAPFLAYLLLTLGSSMRHRAFGFRQDLSYGMYIYAFPVQQLLAIVGVRSPLLMVGGAVIGTALLAAGSWFLVERPALAFKGRTQHRTGDALPVVGQTG